jgi:hypothetical protein
MYNEVSAICLLVCIASSLHLGMSALEQCVTGPMHRLCSNAPHPGRFLILRQGQSRAIMQLEGLGKLEKNPASNYTTEFKMCVWWKPLNFPPHFINKCCIFVFFWWKMLVWLYTNKRNLLILMFFVMHLWLVYWICFPFLYDVYHCDWLLCWKKRITQYVNMLYCSQIS